MLKVQDDKLFMIGMVGKEYRPSITLISRIEIGVIRTGKQRKRKASESKSSDF